MPALGKKLGRGMTPVDLGGSTETGFSEASGELLAGNADTGLAAVGDRPGATEPLGDDTGDPGWLPARSESEVVLLGLGGAPFRNGI